MFTGFLPRVNCVVSFPPPEIDKVFLAFLFLEGIEIVNGEPGFPSKIFLLSKPTTKRRKKLINMAEDLSAIRKSSGIQRAKNLQSNKS